MGGAENLVVSLARQTLTSEEVALCCLYDSNDLPLCKEADKAGIPIWHLGKHKGFDPRMFWRVKKVLLSYRPDVIHTHLSVLRYVLPSSTGIRNVARVHTIHTMAEHEVDGAGKALQQFAFRHNFVKPVGLSELVRKSIEELYGVRDVPVIFNGIPTSEYVSASRAPKQEIRANLGLSTENVVILHVGSFSPQKNHNLLVKAFSSVHKRFQNIELWFAGDGELRQSIEQLVDGYGLTGAVKFLGIRRDIPKLMSAADIFVLSSDWEGVPLVVLEGMAAGLPIVSTEVGGVSELLDHEVTGLLTPKGDAEALGDALLRLSLKCEVRVLMGKAAQKVATSRFDISVTARRYLDLYRQTM